MRPVVGLLAVSALFTAEAATLTWDADPAAVGAQDGAGAWNIVTTNWWDGTANTNWNSATPDSATFGAGVAAAGTVLVAGTQAVSALTFLPAGSGNYVLGNGRLNLAGSALIDASADATIASVLGGTAGLTKIGAGAVTLTGTNVFTGPVALNNGSLVFNSAGAHTIGAVLSGTGRLVQAGSGLLLLGASNIFSGSMLVTNIATLRITNSYALGASSGVTLSGNGSAAALELVGGLTVSGVPLQMRSATAGNVRSTLTGGAGSNQWAGPVTVAGDGLCQFSPNSGQTLVVAGNTTESGVFAGTIFIRGAGNGYVTGVINSPGGTLSKTDTGAWTITSTGHIWKATQVAVGTLTMGAANAMPPVQLTMGQGDGSSPTLELNGFNQTVTGLVYSSSGGNKLITSGPAATLTVSNGTDYSYNGPIRGALSLYKAGLGVLELRTNHTFTGSVTVAAGTLQLAGAGSFYNSGAVAGAIRVEPGATLRFARSDSLGDHASTSTVVLTVQTNGLVQNSNSFTTLRNLVLAGGELRAAGGAATNFGAYQLKGTVTASGDSTSLISAPGTLSGNVFIQLGNNTAGAQTTFQVANGAAAVDLLVEAPLADGRAVSPPYLPVPSGFIKTGNGTMRLTSNSTFTGTASVNAGVLALGANASVTGDLVVASGAVLDVTDKTSLTVGAGQMLRGSGVVTGSVTAADGARVLGGGVGVPGTLTIAGDLALGGGYTNVFDLTNSLTAGGGVNDLLVVNGDLDGGLSVFRINALAPLVSGSYRLIEYTGAETIPFTAAVLGSTTRDGLAIVDAGTGVVELAVTAGTPQALRWNPVFDGNWNLGTSNWVDQATGLVTDRFYELDTVLFDDAGAFGATVTVATAVRPGGLTVNSASNYMFTGPGTLGEWTTPVGLVKQGAGRLTMAVTNTWSGDLQVQAGTLALAAPNVLPDGAGKGNAAINGTLALGGFAETLNELSGSGLITNNGALTTFTLNNAAATGAFAGVISGPVNFTKLGTGTLYLAAQQTYSGTTTIAGAGSITPAAGSRIVIGTHNALPPDTTLVRNPGALWLNGYTQELGGLISAASYSIYNGSTNKGTLILNVSATPIIGYLADGATGDLARMDVVLMSRSGTNVFTLDTNNDYLGDTTVHSNSRAAINGANSFGPGPSTITLNEGAIYGAAAAAVIGTNKTVVLGPTGGYLQGSGGSGLQGLTVSARITGAGPLQINRDNGVVAVGHTNNDYSGDTVIGVLGPLSATGTTTRLKLLASEVLPSGPGKGNVSLSQANSGQLDLNGFTETINGLAGDGRVINLAGAGLLRVGDNDTSSTFDGRLEFNVALTKIGAGTLTLTGNNTNSGAITVSAGTLALSGSGSFSNAGLVLVQAAGTLDVAARPGFAVAGGQILFGRGAVTGDVATLPGAQIRPDGFNSVHTLTFRNSLGLNAASTNGFDLTGTLGVGGGTNDLVVVGGLLEPSNSVIVVNPLQPLASGTYTLFTYAGAKSTTFNTNLTGNATRKTWTLDEGTPGLVNLVVAGGYGDLVWRPGLNGNWDLAVSTNWYDGAATSAFYQADAVTFDDSGAYSNLVTLAGTLLPAAVVVNASSTYVWQGTGKISGTTTVVKAGSGVLEVRTTNDYSGGTLVSNGTLAVFQNNTLGSGTVTVAAPARVRLGTAGITNGARFAGAGSLQADTLGTGTTSLLLTNAASTFVGTINVGPAAAGGGKVALDNGFGIAAAVNISNNATLFLRSGSNHVGSLRLEGGDTGESLGQLRLELNSVWSGPVTLAGDIGPAADGFFGNNTAGTFGFINGAIGEAGGPRQLSKVGAGTIRLNGTNTYRGGTRLTAGVLDVPEISDLGPSGLATNGLLTFAGGTLRYSGAVDARTARAVTNSGAQTIEVTNAVRLTLTGPQSGGGAMNKNGAGTLAWASNVVFTTSGYVVNKGTLLLDGGSYTSTAVGTGDLIGNTGGERAVVIVSNDVQYTKTENIAPGWAVNATGILRMCDGRVAMNQLRVSAAAGSAGAVYHLGGSLSALGDSAAGYNSVAGYGYYGLHGGSLTNGNWMQVARLGSGAMRVDGGTWDLTSTANGIVVGNSSGTGVLHIAGGTVRAAGRLGVGWAGAARAEATIDGGADVVIGVTGVQFNVSNTATTFGVLNLNGGVLTTSNLYKQVAGGYSVVNFNGGTLRGRGSQVLLGPGTPAAGALDAAYVHAGGAVIDSSNLTVTISQNLLAPPGGGVTALPWSGPLAGYIGAPIVAIRGGDGTGATAVALFDQVSGTVTGLLVTSPGVGYSVAPNVTLFGGGPASTNLGDATLAANASGGLTKLGAGTLVLAGTNTYTGVTVVATGTLLLNGTHNGGPVSVPTNGTLGGTGTVNAAVTVQAAGTLQPGLAATAGALAVSSVTWSADARFSPLVNGTASVLRVTGVNGLTVPSGAAVARVDVFNVALAVGTYTVIDYAGAIQGGAASNLVLGSYLPRAVMYLTNNTANTSIDLVVVSVGEPIKWVGNVSGQWNINAPTNWATALGGVPTAYLQPGLVGDALVFDDSAVGNFAITLQTNVAPAALVASNELNDYTLGGVQALGGTAQLRKYGAATFTLAASNTLSGGAAIYGGTLRLGDGATVGTVGTGPITNNGVLAIDHAATSVFANVLSGTGSLLKAGAGRVTLASVPATNISGTTVNGGTLELINVNASKGPLVINDGGNVEATVIDAINHYSTITVNRGGRLVHAGGNYNQFYNSNLGGTILLMNGGRLEATVPPHATYGNFLLRGNMLVGGTNTSVVAADFRMGDNATRTVTVGETGEDIDLDFQGYVSHFHGNTWGYMTKAGPGTMAFSGPSNFVGIGKLTVNEGRALFLDTMNGGLGNGGLTDNAEVEARIGAGTNQTFVSAINGTGTLIKTGAGSLSLTGLVSGTLNVRVDGGVLEMSALNTYAGSTVISAGTLRVNGRVSGPVTLNQAGTLGGSGVVGGAVTQDGVIAPGAGIGKLTISNQVTDGVTAVYRFELGGTNAPTDYDQLVISDVHTLQGTLEVVVTNGYVPASGDLFNILTNSGLGGLLFGTFTTVSAPALASGLGWEVQYAGTESASLVVTGTVSGGLSAYEQWAQSITNPALRGEQADADGDGYANLLEYSQGTDATNSADNAKLSLLRTNGQFLVLFNRVNSATDIVYEVEGAYLPTNNALWLGIATNVIGSWGGSTNVNDNNTAAVHRVLVTDLLIGTNRSLRLKVTRP